MRAVGSFVQRCKVTYKNQPLVPWGHLLVVIGFHGVMSYSPCPCRIVFLLSPFPHEACEGFTGFKYGSIDYYINDGIVIKPWRRRRRSTAVSAAIELCVE